MFNYLLTGKPNNFEASAKIEELENNMIISYIKNNKDSEDKNKKCMKKIYTNDKIKDINIIGIDESKSDMDTKIVVTEIILENGTSEKHDTKVELINKDWKIVNSYILENL